MATSYACMPSLLEGRFRVCVQTKCSLHPFLFPNGGTLTLLNSLEPFRLISCVARNRYSLCTSIQKLVATSLSSQRRSASEEEYQRSRRSRSSQEVGNIEHYVRDTLGSYDSGTHSPWVALQRRWSALSNGVEDRFQRVLYRYYNWRDGTSSDLFLIFLLLGAFILFGAVLKYSAVDPLIPGAGRDAVAETSAGIPADQLSFWARLWPDVYEVTLLTFGENFPSASESWALQVYSVVMALVGVVGFALVLGLTERIILEVIESNVKQGTKVYESGHVLVLTQAVAGKDMEALWRVLAQVCWAYASSGGTTIVVLSNREKLSMERVYRDAIPDMKGSTIVFRKGNPLLPADLMQVSCASAASVIIVADNSREGNEADAQSVRTSIMIDELVTQEQARALRRGAPLPPAPRVVVELLNSKNCKALQFATDIDVHMVLTRNLNAKRLARMVVSPVLAGISSMLFDFRSTSQQYSHCYPELAGRPFKDVPFLFDNATVIGLFPEGDKDNLVVDPSPGHIMQAGDRLLLLRPSSLARSQVEPRMSRRRPTLQGWKPPILQDLLPTATGLPSGPVDTMSSSFTLDSLRSGSWSSGSDSSGSYEADVAPRRIAAAGNGAGSSSVRERGPHPHLSSGTVDGAHVAKGVSRGLPHYSGTQRTSGSSVAAKVVTVSATGSEVARAEQDRFYVLPNEWQARNENEPLDILVVGWAQQSFMEALLTELDHGEQSLPVASRVTFVNTHDYAPSVGVALERANVACLHVSHIHANPTNPDTFDDDRIPFERLTCAMCLCDSLWVDPDADSSNGIDFMEQGDMLRLDSMLLLVQLNIRTALKAKNRQDINIICEKLAIAGVTRFEDRFRLPLGISVNFTSYAAKLLVQTTFDPEYGIRLVTSFGRYISTTVVDTSVLCTQGEMLSWWDLVARAQTCRLVLFAHFDIPATLDIPLKLHSNPLIDRNAKRVWNDGSHRCKLICFRTRAALSAGVRFSGGSVTGSSDTIDIRSELAADPSVTMRPHAAPALRGMQSGASDESIQVVDLNELDAVQNLLKEEGVKLPEDLAWTTAQTARPNALRTYAEPGMSTDESEADAGVRGSAPTRAQSVVEALIEAEDSRDSFTAYPTPLRSTAGSLDAPLRGQPQDAASQVSVSGRPLRDHYHRPDAACERTWGGLSASIDSSGSSSSEDEPFFTEELRRFLQVEAPPEQQAESCDAATDEGPVPNQSASIPRHSSTPASEASIVGELRSQVSERGRGLHSVR